MQRIHEAKGAASSLDSRVQFLTQQLNPVVRSPLYVGGCSVYSELSVEWTIPTTKRQTA